MSDRIEKLAHNLKDQSLQSLEDMEKAIQLARNLKQEMKRNDVPPEDIDRLRSVWNRAQHTERISVTMNVLIEVSACDSDPCSVYPSIVYPEYMRDWDAYDFLEYHPDVRNDVEKAVATLKDLLEYANRVHHEFEQKHDVPAGAFLD